MTTLLGLGLGLLDKHPNPNPNPNQAAAFTTSGVPFPFKSREQFERSVRAPIGPEWNPAASHAALTKPKVHTLKGVIIDPLADHHKRQAGAEPKGKPKASKRTKR